MQKIKCVFFDIGGVLIDHITAFNTLSRQHSIPEKESLSFFRSHADDIDRGTLSWDAFEKIYCNMFHPVQSFQPNFLESLVRNIQIIQQTHDLIYELRDRYDVGILSNMSEDFLHLVKEHNLIPNIHYTAIIISGAIGSIKPEQKIFDHALSKVNRLPEELLFIDDKEVNVKAAQSYGWNSYQFITTNPTESVEMIRKSLI
ncbi:HAD-IA family hydrolase [Candidatus Roizmanbacteria bacterium]|nr:HAD-IA family hydrolase [Candidatus Roizmanbacteria bacterium]